MKKIKRGQALVETIIVLSIYFFMLSFIISGYQLIFNRTIINIASYEYARSIVAYESSKKFIDDVAPSSSHSNYVVRTAEETGKYIAEAIVEGNTFAYPYLKNITFETRGIRAADAEKGQVSNKYFGNQHMYVQTVINADMEYLFPIVSTDLSGIIADSAHICSAFTMAKERVWQ